MTSKKKFSKTHLVKSFCVHDKDELDELKYELLKMNRKSIGCFLDVKTIIPNIINNKKREIDPLFPC